MKHLRFLLRSRGWTDVCQECGPIGFFFPATHCPRCIGAAMAAAGYGGT